MADVGSRNHKVTWTAEYTVRLNNAGEFQLPETRVEALYASEIWSGCSNTFGRA